MTMNATTLANAIIQALNIPAQDTKSREAWQTVSETIINHITTNAVVTTTGTATAQTGTIA